MLVLSRRFLVIIALMFWQGGFTFYASVVVPMGQQVLGSHRRQGFITQRVSNYLNLSGAIALVPLAWDVASTRDPRRWRRLLRWLCWLGMLGTLSWLHWQHGVLDELLDTQSRSILDHELFTPAHRQYLWTSTAQWSFGLGFVASTLFAWRGEDRRGYLKGAQEKSLAGGTHGVAQSPEHTSSETRR